MEAGNKGAVEAGGHSLGLKIELPFGQRPSPYDNVRLSFCYLFVRKVIFVKYSVAYIVMPDSLGTLEELAEALALIQTLRSRPFPVVLRSNNYLGWLGRMVQGPDATFKLISPEYLDFIRVGVAATSARTAPTPWL
jgi:predicted Rossmann-fold nucleotide-binding protein